MHASIPALAAALITALIAAPAQAADARASRIERVTVYPGLAAVERSARVAAGARELVLDCLSPDFDLGSLRMDADAGIRLGPVSAVNRPRAEVAECSAHPLDARIRALEDRIAIIDAEDSGHGLALGYLRGLGAAEAASAPRAAPPAPPAAALPATLAAIQRGGQQALLEQHRLQREREALARELQPLISERERSAKPQGEVRQLRIALAASSAGQLRLHYQVAGPTWAPAYRAALDADAGQVDIERLAQVSQRSGEDWVGVALRLSTGSPRGATRGPQPRPWQVSPRPPEVAMMERATPTRAFKALAAPASAAMAARDQADEPEFAVQVMEGEFATEFEVPGTVDVGSGAQRVSLSLGSARWPATVKVQTTPAADASAWLVAELPRPTGVWPEGPLRLMRGNQVVGQSVFSLGTREQLTLPFGRDEQVRVQVIPVPQQSSESGFISTRSERRIARAYTVENRRRTPVQLEVLEATPVATDEKISVTRQFDPAPRAGNWQDQPGVVAWALTLAPGQTQRFTAEYLISHPKDMPITESR